MTIKITDMTTDISYIATCRGDCKGIDQQLWDLMAVTGRNAAMGHTVGEFI